MKTRGIVTALRWIVYVAAALVLNFPIIVTLVTAFKSAGELSVNPGLWVFQPTFDNFLGVLQVSDRLNIYAYLGNSLAASLIGSLLAILLAFPAAYAIVRGEFGRRFILPTIVNLRAVPLIIFAIPIYMMFQFVGLLDTQLGLGLILTIVNVPLALIILVNAIGELPIELDEAARIDGATTFQIMWQIIRPVTRSAITTAAIFGFITAWNEFLFGLMITTNNAVPVTVGASFYFSASGGGVQWGLASAVMIVGALPPAILGLLAYRQIGGSLTAGAVKG